MKKTFFNLFRCVFILVFSCFLPSQSSAESIELPEITDQDFDLPEIQVVQTKNGITAWLIEENATPVIAMNVLFKGGSASDPERLKGLSSLVMSLLDEGAGDLRAEKFTEILAQKGISMSFSASKNALFADLETLRENKEEAFSLFSLALANPRFDKKSIKQVKDQIYTGIKARQGSPKTIASKRWSELVYASHPYQDLEPTKKTLSSISKLNLKKFVQTRFAKDNMIVGVVGNISASELKPLLEKTFQNLPKQAFLKDVPSFEPNLEASEDLVEMDIPQSVVLFGHQGFQRSDKDYYAAVLLNYVFGGGGLSSRLFEEVREKNGLVYSIYTYLNTDKLSAMFMGGIGTDNKKRTKAIELVRNQWEKIKEYGLTQEELKDAKTYMTGSFPLAFSSSSGLASFLLAMQYHDLGIDYLKNYKKQINDVSLSEVNETAKRLFKPENLFFVIVGKPDTL